MNTDLLSLVDSDPERMGGDVCFAGTRVPLRNLFDYLATGHSLQDFDNDFPGAGKERAIAILDTAKDLLDAQTRDESQRARQHGSLAHGNR
jgi:uncharacterized protein (DUF433 family)